MIDWQRVRELEDEVGVEDFAEVAALFIEEVDEVVQKLKDLPTPETFETDFHFLKGSALNLGFQEFATLCAMEERRAAESKHSEINISAALDCYQASRKEFIARQQSEKAA